MSVPEAMSGADSQGLPGSPALPGGSLKYTWVYGDKGAGGLPMVIPGDSARDAILIYVGDATNLITVTRIGAPEFAAIRLYPPFVNYEMRMRSHGPIVQDQWTLDAPAAGSVTVLLISKEGM